MVQGVNTAQSQVAQQQSLFAQQSQSQSSEASTASSASENSAGSVKQQAQVSVLKESMELKQQNMQKLLNSTQGVGQNVDTFA